MPNRTNLLHGLTPKRFLTALVINALIAAALYRVAWEGNFGSAMVSAQIVGLSILLSWTMASNWKQKRVPPLFVQLCSVVLGSNVGGVLVVLVKGYELDQVIKNPEGLINLIALGVMWGAFIILIVIAREREARAQAAMHQAEAERHLHGKQLLEARLQLMQAQIEPHFLFNALGSVHHLIETDTLAASRMLGDLIKYLRAAMPQMRENTTTIGREAELVRAYLSIQRVRMGNRVDVALDIPEALKEEAFPPMMLLTLVENAVKHGFEAQGGSGSIQVRVRGENGETMVEVCDTGVGLRTDQPDGVGLTNVRERLKALYGDAARLVLEENAPRGVRALISVPAARQGVSKAVDAGPGDAAPAPGVIS
jgi:two-component sensor histidine kinase